MNDADDAGENDNDDDEDGDHRVLFASAAHRKASVEVCWALSASPEQAKKETDKVLAALQAGTLSTSL